MNKIQFTVDEIEVKSLAKVLLSQNQIDAVLTTVECDEILWGNIQESIKSAIKIVLSE